jgi:hypothetical protein
MDRQRPLPADPKIDLRQVAATQPTRSALAVPPDYGGLLRSRPCGFVAPRCRSWGSLRFAGPPCDGSPPRSAHPSKLSPPQQPLRVATAVALAPLARRSDRRRVATVAIGAARFDLRALLRCEIRCSSRGLRLAPSPLLPWAWLHARQVWAVAGSRGDLPTPPVEPRRKSPSRGLLRATDSRRASTAQADTPRFGTGHRGARPWAGGFG